MDVLAELLQVLAPGSHVAVVTMTGSCCPVTLAHVQCFIEARRILMGQSARPNQLEVFHEVVGFLSLNSDAHVSSKLREKKEPYISYEDRARLVQMATAELVWLNFNPRRENEAVAMLRRTWPKLWFVHFKLNGADDVLKYQKFKGASTARRSIAMGRPGVTEKLRAAVRKAGIDVEKGEFFIGPELPDISSTEVRSTCRAGDVVKLNQLVESHVAIWCMSKHSPYQPVDSVEHPVLGPLHSSLSDKNGQEQTAPPAWKLKVPRAASEEARERHINDGDEGSMKTPAPQALPHKISSASSTWATSAGPRHRSRCLRCCALLVDEKDPCSCRYGVGPRATIDISPEPEQQDHLSCAPFQPTTTARPADHKRKIEGRPWGHLLPHAKMRKGSTCKHCGGEYLHGGCRPGCQTCGFQSTNQKVRLAQQRSSQILPFAFLSG